MRYPQITQAKHNLKTYWHALKGGLGDGPVPTAPSLSMSQMSCMAQVVRPGNPATVKSSKFSWRTWVPLWSESLDAPCSEYMWICTYIHPSNYPNVGKYSIHGAYGLYRYIKMMVSMGSWSDLSHAVVRMVHFSSTYLSNMGNIWKCECLNLHVHYLEANAQK